MKWKLFKRKILSCLLIFILMLCAGCQSEKTGSTAEDNSAAADLFAMDTYMTLTAYGEGCQEAVEAASKEIQRIDRLFSAGDPESVISHINASGGGSLDEETRGIIEQALEIYGMTGGCFDITVYPLAHLWGFTDGEMHLPSDDEIKQMLEYVGSDALRLEGDKLILDKGQGIDLGGIAKGYASDKVMRIFEENGASAGVVSLGGNVQCAGTKPDGSLWKVGIQKPGEEGIIGVLQTKGAAVITSGGYERYFTGDDGTIYHHILDPATGYPAKSGIKSCTVVSDSGIEADALSTACFIMGIEKASDLWREHREEFSLIIMDENEEIYITEDLKESFSTDYTVHVIG